MNHARIDVALQGVAHAARAAQISQAYASERKQGRKLDGTPARLSDHADVQRMLSEQQILAIGTRAMCHIALVELESNARPALAEFLTPLCKIAGSEAGIKAADLGIQILGGYGYLTEYGLSQVWRDARITAIYEGTNGIHARSLATRGLRPGAGSEDFADLITELGGDHPVVSKLLADWHKAVQHMTREADPLPLAQAFTELSSQVLQAAVWCRIDALADQHPTGIKLKRLAAKVLSPSAEDPFNLR